MTGRSPEITANGRQQNDLHETTPLLKSTQNGHLSSDLPNGDRPPANGQHDIEEEPESKPMPYAQIILLCYTALAEPVAYFSIFPFINEMIHLVGGVEESSVGFWSGLIESLFSLVQMVLMIFYGRASDRFGRKPVLVFSLTGIAIASAAFGMSRSLPQMIGARCVAGLFAGSVVTVRTMLAEHTTKETQGTAFSWFMFTRNMGILVGPIIGVS